MKTRTGGPATSAPPTERYGLGEIAFHWCSAGLLVWVGVLGLMHDSWPKQTQASWINIHALSGLLLWALVIARLWWRSQHLPPALPPDISDYQRRLAKVIHWILYGLLLIIPVIGIITFIWHGRAFDFGLFQLNLGVKSNKAIFHPTEDVHGYLAYLLFTFAGAHALAALFHHYIRQDNILRRMWPMS